MFKIRFNKKIAFSNNSHLRFSVVRKVFHTFLYHKKGVVLLVVLGTLLVVTSLAAVILSLILTHVRFTHHQTSRIQAYYAAMAGINYALGQLRTGTWTYTPVNSCPGATGCTNCGCLGPTAAGDSDFPNSIKSFDGSTNRQFRVIFCSPGSICGDSVLSTCNAPTGSDFCIYVTTRYTYTAP